MASGEVEHGIVEYFGTSGGHRCGYCGGSDSNHSHGMWAHSLTVQEYQDLIDRGWRRSGKYCYKPTMKVTCCPHYTIKCEALNFKLNKSHKKILKQVNKFLIHGIKRGEADRKEETSNKKTKDGGVKMEASSSAMDDNSNTSSAADVRPTSAESKKKPRPGDGADPNKPPMKKAKEIRLQKRLSRQSLNSEDISQNLCHRESTLSTASTMSSASTKSAKNEPKTLEDFLSEPDRAEKCAHKLEIKLVRSAPRSKEFQKSFKAAHQVYHKYQMEIHHDPPHKPNEGQYTRFLVDSPLEIKLIRTTPKSNEYKKCEDESHCVFKAYQMKIHNDQAFECTKYSWLDFLVESPLKEEHREGGLPMGYGSFHQQYILDGQIIAVGVIDILPNCVSSVYLYYHPDYDFLSLGTYTALREIAFVRELNKRASDLIYYYMGYYIHSCPKMKYKGQYHPSFLLCPETYTWCPISEASPKLDVNKYSRFAEESVEDEGAKLKLDNVLILFCRQMMNYEIYKALNAKAKDQKEIMEYAFFVGRKCAERLLLFRK